MPTFSEAELGKAERLSHLSPIYRVDPKTIVKFGDRMRSAEAATMNLVREKTSVPVPEVYNVYKDESTGHVGIVMEFVEGDRLETVWDSFDDGQKNSVIDQLRKYFTELRQIKGSFIGSVDATACEDPIFDENVGSYGPYALENRFNEGLIKALKKAQTDTLTEMVCEMIQSTMEGHEIVLTHGDLAPRNVLVRGTKVVSILDWELSGYYPEYWEYYKALRRPPWESGWIKDRAVDRILKPYPVELAVMWHTRDVIW